MSSQREFAHTLIQERRYHDALRLLQPMLYSDPEDWRAWYLAGQCHRFIGDTETTVAYLSRARELSPQETAVLLALGIALQLQERFPEAIAVFVRAIDIDPDFVLAYNSLALTQRKAGELVKALHNYDAGAKALFRKYVKDMRNVRSNLIFKHRDTVGTLWVEQASYAALYCASSGNGIEAIVLPSGEGADEEERTERHGGLYWFDSVDAAGRTCRNFLPNFFNTLRERACTEGLYSQLIGNRGTVLDLLGRSEEAESHFRRGIRVSGVSLATVATGPGSRVVAPL